MSGILWIDPSAPVEHFPPAESALAEPNGLLAAGGDLTPGRLIAAYRRGIFPWYSDAEPILWWSPDPRAVLDPGGVHTSRRLRRRIRSGNYRVTADRRFAEVIDSCAGPRRGQYGTWLTADMRVAYRALHEMGVAHSIEVWQEDALVGGLYGVALGRAFFGESMFSRRTDGSKIALAALDSQLARWGFALIDCQVGSSHLARMGVMEVPRRAFLERLQAALEGPERRGAWRLDDDLLTSVVLSERCHDP